LGDPAEEQTDLPTAKELAVTPTGQIATYKGGKMIFDLNKKESKIIVWGGLRGGLSIALVLSLPDSEARNILLVATYMCVLFSILVQGLTIEKVAKYNG